MSGITGTVNLDGRPVERELLQRMARAIAHRGPDGIACWIEGPVGLGHLMFHTTPESLRETQPLTDEAGHLCLTLDGRVDNRDELRAALEGKGLPLRANTDAELVLRAYEHWGEGCPQHLIGDFAFAIWNGRERTLFCARDPLGVRTFYYLLDRGAFSFSSELRPLLDLPNFQSRPNLGMLGEYLSDNVTSLHDTLYQGIQRLPPGHQLVLKSGALRIKRYFNIDPRKAIRYRSDPEYAEHFFDIFQEAVRCRLRSQTPVSHFVSGGLDSSSILGMTHHLIRVGVIEQHRPAVYSLLSSHPAADERSYLDDMANMWGDSVHTASMDHATAKPLLEQVQRLRDFPDPPDGASTLPLYRLARQNGSRVSFSGFGGDEWLTGSRAHCADLLLQLKFPALLRQMRHDVAQSNIWGSRIFSLRDALRWCLFPLIPQALKSQIKRYTQSGVPRWITPGFARTIRLQERLLRPAPPPFPSMAQRAMHGVLLGGWHTLANEILNRFDAHHGMEGRYPFYDRRLIEFCFALPEDQRWRDDQPKYVLRQAMNGLLPESIATRRSKAEFSHLYQELIARESTREAFQSLHLAAEGYIDARVATEMYDSCVRGDVLATGPVWMMLALECWYRATFPATA